MGFNLYIGEAVACSCMEERHAWIEVERVTLDEAPLNSNEDHSNAVFPSYTAWAAFCREVGLERLFYAGGPGQPPGWWKDDQGVEHTGLLYRHPGAEPLTEAHYRAFVAARDAYQADNVYNQRRLEWLVWWTRWALDHCQWPTFRNS